MNVSRLFYSLIGTALVAVCPLSAAVTADDIAPYVYPANASAAPGAMTYLGDGKTYVSISDDGKRIVKYDIKSGKELGVMLDVETARESRIKSIQSYILSPDESYILVCEKSESIYRRSSKAAYYVYEVRHNIFTPLSTEHPVQRAPQWSPDGRMIAFVADNNIYIRKLDYNTEVAVTKDGEINKVINGVPDWVYEEEFDTTCSMVWSPDNLTFCYLKYNEIDVPMYSFTLYEGTCDPKTDYTLYPGRYTYKYPVAGKPNSRVTLHSYDIDTRKTKDIVFNDERIEYIPRIAYAYRPERLMVTTLNRAQNRIEMYAVNPKSTVAKSVYVDEASTGWIDPSAWENTKFYPDFFMITSEQSGYNHVYQYSYSGARMRQVTSGDFDVTAYYGCEPVSGVHYFQSTVSGAVNRVVSRVDAKGKVTDLGDMRGVSSASFSPDMAYMTLSYSNVTTPPVHTLCTSAGKEIRILEDNAGVRARYGNIPTKEFFTVASDGYTLNGFVLKPSDFSSSRKYPVIMYQYSGPGSQEVLDRWRMDWDYFFVQQGYIVMCVDGRGTGGRGKAFKDCVYRNLGHYETIDQINAAKYAASLPYVSKVGIFGWSYGGYESLMAASQYDYDAAVAVAPVTDWRYYDTVYAERYMLTPQENEDGYNSSAPVNYVDRIKTPLLIMHGTADDNVHLMNTMQYVSALQSSGKVCDMLLFPNMNHSINGCNSRSLVYLNMLNFFDRNLK